MPYDNMGNPTRRPLGVRALMLVVLVAWMGLAVAACGSASATVQPTATTAVPQPTATPDILFQADWSRGLSGWQATPGWSVVNGGLQNELGAERSLTVPFQPPAGAYVVELDIQIVSIPSNGGYFIFDVPQGANGDGYQAGVQNLRAPDEVRPNGDHPTIRSLVAPLSDQDTSLSIRAMTDYEPGDAVRTYRIAVDGKSLSMYVDGRYYVGTATIGPTLASSPLVLRVSGAVFRIMGLRVLAA